MAFREFDTPAYPEEAVYLSVADRACERHHDELAGRPVMEILSRPDLLTGERSSRLFHCGGSG
jgi:hypothetical protein